MKSFVGDIKIENISIDAKNKDGAEKLILETLDKGKNFMVLGDVTFDLSEYDKGSGELKE